MQPVKINIYISFVPSDKVWLDKLLEWLYPIRDEVNLIYNNPPPPPEPLPLPWQLLLFWYTLPDARRPYSHTLRHLQKRAHIYLFLTSYKSLSSSQIGEEITEAVNRYIEQGDKYLRIFPVIVSPCLWQEKSRLGRFKPIGPKKPLSAFKPDDEAFLELTDQLSKVIQSLQRNLDERVYAGTKALGPGNKPVVADQEELYTTLAQPVQAFRPPEWLGWVILLGLIVATLASLGPKNSILKPARYQNIPKFEKKPPEYHRDFPMMPPPADNPLPVPEDSTYKSNNK
jgi:hypothetical protein